MSMTVKIAGNPTLSIVDDDGTDSTNLGFEFDTTGSNRVSNTQRVNTTWTSLDTGSCADIRMIIVKNTTTASVQIASDAAGTKPIVYTYPTDVAVIPWSGSNAFWAKSFGNPVDINVKFVES